MSVAFAADVANSVSGAPKGGGVMEIVMLAVFVGVFYFLIIRPQAKRAKTQRNLITNLAVGDEVVTTGGIAGKITKISDPFLTLSVAKEVALQVQKQAIGIVLPKGTLSL